MAAVLPGKLLQLARAAQFDPKKAILDGLGSALDKITVRNNLVLVGTYIASEKTKGGILRPAQSMAEDLYQGNIGLVLKKGPMAFKDDARLNIYWDGQDVEIGQWVLLRYSSAWETHLNGVSVRFVEDREIKADTSDPELFVSKPHIAAS